MAFGPIFINDPFFVAISDTNPSGRLNERSNSSLMSKSLNDLCIQRVSDAETWQLASTIYVCVPIAEIDKEGHLKLVSEFEAMARCAAVIGDARLNG